MSEQATLDAFFATWSIASAEARQSDLVPLMADAFVYADPQTTAPVTTLDQLVTYIGAFSANAPDWNVAVAAHDAVAGHVRALVRFAGPGPSDATVEQFGTYFAEFDEAGRITRLVGFVGKEIA
ncbi:MAG: nuclear transport factor 2 family protein [Pseudomonadota bacterium]